MFAISLKTSVPSIKIVLEVCNKSIHISHKTLLVGFVFLLLAGMGSLCFWAYKCFPHNRNKPTGQFQCVIFAFTLFQAGGVSKVLLLEGTANGPE